MTVDKTLRLTAWNGVSIIAPDSWEAAVTGVNHLHFEDQLTPIFEIRWEKVPAKGSSSSIDRSIKQIESLSGRTLSSCPVPPFIDKLLPGLEKFSYTWQDRTTTAVLLLYCSTCSTFFLLQFFHDENDLHHPLHHIESLHCHDKENDINSAKLWSIQDFQVSVPLSFNLSGYNMAAGFSKLTFLNKKSVLHICRIAPAAIRLRKQNLKDTFTILADLKVDESVHSTSEKLIQYERYPTVGMQILMRLQKKKPFCLAALWHDEENDRLLCVIMEGIHPLDQQNFNIVRSSYEILSSKKQ